jgi:orotate phosphoribosyltransferase
VSDPIVAAGLLDPDEADAFLRRGHFAFESGDHGDAWLQLERLFTSPRRLQRAADALAAKLRAHRPDLVCGPALGGALVGQAVAVALDVPFVFAERQAAKGGVAYAIPSGVRALVSGRRAAVVDDAINAGSAAVGTARELRSLGADVVALGVLVARASAVLPLDAFGGVTPEALVSLEWNLWPPASCPLCAAGAPISSPLRQGRQR